MTHDIVYDRRVRLINYAAKIDTVARPAERSASRARPTTSAEGAAPAQPGHRSASGRGARVADAAETGQITDAALEGEFGFCVYASRPAKVVSLDTSYVGRPKGVGALWQLAAIDVAPVTRACSSPGLVS